MLYFFRILLLLINLDQETVLNWFGVESSTNSNIFSQKLQNDSIYSLNSEFELSTKISFETWKLLIEGLIQSESSK